MISVIIPTLNAERTLAPTLAALVPAVVEGIVQEAIVVDGGSTDETRVIAEAAGTVLIEAPRGRGSQLEAGASQARADWLLFLHADTVLEPGWAEEAQSFMERVASGRRDQAAASFRFALDDDGLMPRFVEWLVGLRCQLLALPYGDQGLLISRNLYNRLGGFRHCLSWRTSISRRLKRRKLVMLKSRAVTSEERYRREARRGACAISAASCFITFAPPRARAPLWLGRTRG
jgi:glycosyltransferase involved in cell wall biosynthesis